MDIEIVLGRDRAYVFGRSNKGKEWLQKNIDRPHAETSMSIPSESVEDMVALMKQSGLMVEIK